jgi:protein-disulfide isomerase
MHIGLMTSRALAPMTPEGKEDLAGTQEEIERVAKSAGLNLDKLNKDMKNDAIELRIQTVHAEAAEAGVEATPGFFVNGQTLQGFNEEQLDKMIAKAKAPNKG